MTLTRANSRGAEKMRGVDRVQCVNPPQSLLDAPKGQENIPEEPKL